MAVVYRSKRALDLADRQLVNLIDDACPGPASEAEPSADVDNSTVDARRHRAAALATGDPATLPQSDRHTRADGKVGVRIKPAVGAGRAEHKVL